MQKSPVKVDTETSDYVEMGRSKAKTPGNHKNLIGSKQGNYHRNAESVTGGPRKIIKGQHTL